MSDFFPLLGPRSIYQMKEDGSFWHYKKYHSEVAVDCKHRCVYCDIKTTEHGHEGMVLDHFRPQSQFVSLENDPNNLVLSCPVCNRLKWDRWPVDPQLNCSFLGPVGFIDPFQENRLDYFLIKDDGALKPIKPPASYIEQMLQLNRPSRVKVRKKRILLEQVKGLIDITYQKIEETKKLKKEGKISNTILIRQFDSFLNILKILKIAIDS